MDILDHLDNNQLNNSYKVLFERADDDSLDHADKNLGHTTDNLGFWTRDQCEETDIPYCDMHLKVKRRF